MFENFSNAQLAAIFNAAIDAHSLDAKPVKRFASKAVAIGHLEATMAEFGLSFDGENLVQAGEGGHDPEGQTDGPTGDVDDSDLSEGDGTEVGESVADEGAEDLGEPLDELDPAPFVKLPKDQLPPRGTPEREAYRKARRAAARAARKAREAAE